MWVAVDIPYKLLKAAVEQIEEKQGVCKVLPSMRFMNPGKMAFRMTPDEWNLGGMVCDQLGGESTGTGARTCRNCIKNQSSTGTTNLEERE